MKFHDLSLGSMTKKVLIVDYCGDFCRYVVFDKNEINFLGIAKLLKNDIYDLFFNIKRFIYSNSVISYCEYLIPDVVILFPDIFFSINEYRVKMNTNEDIKISEIEKHWSKFVDIKIQDDKIVDFSFTNKFFNKESGNLIIQYYLTRIKKDILDEVNSYAESQQISIIDIRPKSFYSHLSLNTNVFKENIGFIRIDNDESCFAILDLDLRKICSKSIQVGLVDSFSENEKKLYTKNIIYSAMKFFKNNSNHLNISKCVLYLQDDLFYSTVLYDFKKILELDMFLLKDIESSIADNNLINSYGYIKSTL